MAEKEAFIFKILVKKEYLINNIQKSLKEVQI